MTPTDARSALLTRLRTALQAPANDSARKAAVAARLKAAPNGVIPTRAQLPHKDQIELFLKMAEKVSVTVTRVTSATKAPAAVSEYLRSKNLPARLRMGGDKRLAAMPWAKEKNLEIKRRASDGTDEVCVSHAFGGIAESGTIMLVSGPENPTTLNFLPEHHVIVLNASDIKGDLETLIASLRETYGKGEMPRTVNLVTGPSRSGDIEQTILLGAHGPRAVHLVLVG
jgi:L-lactate dehydrogenase complex protein LldG